MSKVTASIDKYDMDAETITPNDDQIIFSVALPLKQQKIHERICLGLVSKKNCLGLATMYTKAQSRELL